MPDTRAAPAIPASPAEGEPAAAARPSAETLALLAARRSTPILLLGEPGPSRAQIEALVRLAGRVPDHGKLGPWRFIAITGQARARAGAALAELAARAEPNAPAALIEAERASFLRSPASVLVVFSPKPSAKIPLSEQRDSTAMAAYQLLLAAHALGFAGVILTGRVASDPEAGALFGLEPHERIMSVVHLGAAKSEITERVRAPAKLDWY